MTTHAWKRYRMMVPARPGRPGFRLTALVVAVLCAWSVAVARREPPEGDSSEGAVRRATPPTAPAPQGGGSRQAGAGACRSPLDRGDRVGIHPQARGPLGPRTPLSQSPMPAIAPFRALSYAPRLRASLDQLVAPPYDVQSEQQRALLGARHENNIVHVDLPRSPGGDDSYAAAARRVQGWIHDGILVRDAEPAFYLCEQRYRRPSGGETTRRGFFARLTLEPFGAGTVIPHERTLEEPRDDRTRLLAATRLHLSAVFLLHPDPDGEVARVVGAAMDGPTLEQARDDEGTLSRVVRLGDRERIDFLTRSLRRQWALIADGHHRYESTLAYRVESRARGQHDAEHVVAC